jgi:hypothetical protein
MARPAIHAPHPAPFPSPLRGAGKGSVDYSKADPWTCGARSSAAADAPPAAAAAAAAQRGGPQAAVPEARDDGFENHGPFAILPATAEAAAPAP